MKNTIILGLALIYGFQGYAQTKSLVLEVGGNSTSASIDFENQFKSTESHTSFYRVGLGAFPDEKFYLTIPFEITPILGKTSIIWNCQLD